MTIEAILFGGLQVLGGILLADFISGVIHWLEDTYGQEDMPVIGKSVIEPNIRHHYAPLDFVKASYWMRNRAVLVIGAFLFALFWALGAINAFTVTFLVVGSQANEFHRWAHMPSGQRPKLVAWLQRAKIILTPQHHWAHHRRPFRVAYCTVTNVLNPVLDRVRFFRGLEFLIGLTTKAKPREDTGKPPTNTHAAA
ncbi:MAG: hypothetical protein HRU11_01575 [Parvularculaceae bacterium]|nr:hypothetical protein [Parvularculaceae bacterium]